MSILSLRFRPLHALSLALFAATVLHPAFMIRMHAKQTQCFGARLGLKMFPGDRGNQAVTGGVP